MIYDEKADILGKKLVQQLGGLPLALEQAAAYIKSLRKTLSQCLEPDHKQRICLILN